MPTELDDTARIDGECGDDELRRAYRGRALILERPTKALREQLSSSWGSSATAAAMIRPNTLTVAAARTACQYQLTLTIKGEDLDR